MRRGPGQATQAQPRGAVTDLQNQRMRPVRKVGGEQDDRLREGQPNREARVRRVDVQGDLHGAEVERVEVDAKRNVAGEHLPVREAGKVGRRYGATGARPARRRRPG